MATIRDIARESGVSVATVSYVLNDGPRPVSPKTRERVEAVMRRLDYHPNAIARSLVRRRTQTLGVLVGQIQPEVVSNNYYAGILAGVFAGAHTCGYNITFFTMSEAHQGIEHQVRAQQPDGMLLIAPAIGSDLPQRLLSVGFPLGVVGAGDCYAQENVLSVDVDNEAGARLAMEHLLQQGHREIVHVMGNPTQESAGTRHRVYAQLLAEWGLEYRPDNVLARSFEPACIYETLRARLEQPPAPTAIFAGNDDIALEALQAVRDSGRQIPHDIALVGFDDAPITAYTNPGLTTIRQPMREIGEAVVTALVARIKGEAPAAQPLLQRFAPTLVVRGST